MFTPLYASLFAVLHLILSAQVIRIRRRQQVLFGHGDDRQLLKAIRAHGNFTEHVPIFLLLTYFLESKLGPGHILIHALSIIVLLGRILHGIGLNRRGANLNLRFIGMLLTLSGICVSALTLLTFYVIPA